MVLNSVTTALTFIHNAEVCKQMTGQTVFYASTGGAVGRPMLRYAPTASLRGNGGNWTRFRTLIGIDNFYYLGDEGGFLPINKLLERAMLLKDRGIYDTDDILLLVTILRVMHGGWSFNDEWLIPLLIHPVINDTVMGPVEHVIAQFYTPEDVIAIDGLGLEMELLNWGRIMEVQVPEEVRVDPVDVRNFPWETDEETVATVDSDGIIDVWVNEVVPTLEDEELIMLIDLTNLEDEE